LKASTKHKGSVELMVTDVVMPIMSGRDTAKKLQPLYPQMKVIYMSGYTDDAIAHHGVLESGLNYIEKPFTPDELARKTREVIDDN
jgi:two-component system cell cycle sensor histidine kinase/response regulator CckA